MEDRNPAGRAFSDSRLGYQLIVILFAAAVYVGCIISPPSLMDDVDAVQAQIARNMLESGDWVTAHLDGVKYLEKSPLKYWMIAVSYKIFGVHDWAARIPIAISTVLLMVQPKSFRGDPTDEKLLYQSASGALTSVSPVRFATSWTVNESI